MSEKEAIFEKESETVFFLFLSLSLSLSLYQYNFPLQNPQSDNGLLGLGVSAI